ncbi:MAG TPA: hypothetical protein VKH15_10955 [Candidatus Acidoferrum sp.]|nr:hypothetical protein [Candidatus Acidoferrum sp.]
MGEFGNHGANRSGGFEALTASLRIADQRKEINRRAQWIVSGAQLHARTETKRVKRQKQKSFGISCFAFEEMWEHLQKATNGKNASRSSGSEMV